MEKPALEHQPVDGDLLIERQKMGGDLLVERHDHDPAGHPVYHPAIGRYAIAGAVIGGILVGLAAWLIANGTIPISGLGQIGASGTGVAAFFGFSAGSALGGLIGSILGIRRMHKVSYRE